MWVVPMYCIVDVLQVAWNGVIDRWVSGSEDATLRLWVRIAILVHYYIVVIAYHVYYCGCGLKYLTLL